MRLILGRNVKFSLLAIVLSVLTIVLFKALAADAVNNQVTLYPVICKEKVVLGTCEEPQQALEKITYKILPKYAEVIFYANGKAHTKFKDCKIENRNNWSCETGADPVKFGLQDGKYFESKQLRASEKIYHATRMQWLRVQCKDVGSPICLPVAMVYN